MQPPHLPAKLMETVWEPDPQLHQCFCPPSPGLLSITYSERHAPLVVIIVVAAAAAAVIATAAFFLHLPARLIDTQMSTFWVLLDCTSTAPSEWRMLCRERLQGGSTYHQALAAAAASFVSLPSGLAAFGASLSVAGCSYAQRADEAELHAVKGLCPQDAFEVCLPVYIGQARARGGGGGGCKYGL